MDNSTVLVDMGAGCVIIYNGFNCTKNHPAIAGERVYDTR